MKNDENRLIHEKSPYLLQHAHNPVDWYPWSEEAFRRAKDENKLVFLSIGYSTCHWCHVMEHESFEDRDVADAMNRNFICIKVDREERPDIDNFYMTASQILTGSGGWPLNVIATPDRKPIFAMTYIPRNSRGEQMGIIDLSNAIGELWKEKSADLSRRADDLVSKLEMAVAAKPGNMMDERFLKDAFTELKDNFDPMNGGFGSSPKFPTPHYLLFLMRYYSRYGDDSALHMVEKTIEKINLGGIHDHVGGGFHRYSTDAGWFLPHFEKMLYDQGMLMMVFSELHHITGKKIYSDMIEELFIFLTREMHGASGGFYSAIDADSEGVEGKFYTWSYQEIIAVLGQEDGKFFLETFNANQQGNYHDESTGRSTGRNILYLDKGTAEIAAGSGTGTDAFAARIAACRKKLFDYREKRTRPHTDDKILTGLNGIMISALSLGYRETGNDKLLKLAKETADFILEKMDAGEGRLFHTYREDSPAIEGFIDDYAYLIKGLIDLYEASFELKYLEHASLLNESALKEFFDEKDFGFFFTARYRNEVGGRRKEWYDGAIPSGNSVQILNLLRLSNMTENEKLRDIAVKSLDSLYDTVAKAPVFHLYLMCALDFAIGPTTEVKIICGKDGVAEQMIKIAREKYNSRMTIVAADETGNEFYAKFLKEFSPKADGRTRAFVCKNYRCLPETSTAEEFRKQVSNA
ncbi:Thioredoxin-related protein [Thermoplasmatales archaeon]|nr:Thioredoxin-related protein [Thermoplasmatales archaeon]